MNTLKLASLAALCLALRAGACTGTPVTQPMTITQPGDYCVMNYIYSPSGTALTVSADNVSIDLQRNVIATGNATAALIFADHDQLRISNGELRGGGEGLIFTSAGGVVGHLQVDHMLIDQWGTYGIMLYGQKVAATLLDNTIMPVQDWTPPATQCAAGILGFSLYGGRIERNVVKNCTTGNINYSPGNGMLLSGGSGSVVADNEVSGNTQRGISLINTAGTVLRDNRVSGNGTGIAVTGTPTGYPYASNFISHNVVTGNKAYGIQGDGQSIASKTDLYTGNFSHHNGAGQFADNFNFPGSAYPSSAMYSGGGNCYFSPNMYACY